MDLASLRENYTRGGLQESDAQPDPIEQFRVWFQQAVSMTLREPNAMTLATASADGQPSARVVLLKSFDQRGFTFYTNYESRKGRELAENPRAALVFFWAELERQVRITGDVERVSREQSEEYFSQRPEASRIGAWASRQSSVVPNRSALEREYAIKAEEFAATEIPLPPFWGGYRVKPCTIEFWQGRPNRLHDRLSYTRGEDGLWRIERLSP